MIDMSLNKILEYKNRRLYSRYQPFQLGYSQLPMSCVQVVFVFFAEMSDIFIWLLSS